MFKIKYIIMNRLKYESVLEKNLNAIIVDNSKIINEQLYENIYTFITINNYQNKVNSILERDDIKQSVKTGEQYGDQLDKVMTQIKTAYIQSIQEIKSNCKDQNEFLEKVQELDNRIENVLLTDEEKEMIQKVREEINTMFGGEEATAMIKYLPF